MNLLQKLEDRATGVLRADNDGVTQGFVLTERITEERPYGFATQQAYCLELRLSVAYWANDTQHDGERRRAEKLLERILYADTRLPLQGLRVALHARSYEQALKCLDRLSELLEPQS